MVVPLAVHFVLSRVGSRQRLGPPGIGAAQGLDCLGGKQRCHPRVERLVEVLRPGRFGRHTNQHFLGELQDRLQILHLFGCPGGHAENRRKVVGCARKRYRGIGSLLAQGFVQLALGLSHQRSCAVDCAGRDAA
jgi:hypothetical protein